LIEKEMADDEEQKKQIQSFKNALKYNRLILHDALILQSDFFKVILSIPSLDAYLSTLRLCYKSDPDNAVEDLLDKVKVSDDIDMWKEFIKALDLVNKTCRRLFVSDALFRGKVSVKHQPLRLTSFVILSGMRSYKSEIRNSTNKSINVYNLFLNGVNATLYDKLERLELIKLLGFEGSYDSSNLMTITFDSSREDPIIQFLLIDQKKRDAASFQILLNQMFMILQYKLKGSPLVIFGWSNSSNWVRKLIAELPEPPLRAISVKEAFDCTKLSDFLSNFYANLHISIEVAIQTGALSVGINKDIDQHFEMLASSTEGTRETITEAIAIRRGNALQQIFILKIEDPFDVFDVWNLCGSLEGVTRGCILAIFAFDEVKKTLLKKQRSFKFTRGPLIHKDGSINISKSETKSLSFRTYKPEILTERWALISETKWGWKQLLELFQLPGIKFIRRMIDERTIEFEGTLYAKAIAKSNLGNGVKMTSTMKTPTVPLGTRKRKTPDDFSQVTAFNMKKISEGLYPRFHSVVNDVPITQNLSLKSGVVTVPALLSAINSFGVQGWVQFFVALEKNHLEEIRELFLSSEELTGVLFFFFFFVRVDCFSLMILFSELKASVALGKPALNLGHFHEVLVRHRMQIHRAITPYFEDILSSIPALSYDATSYRVKYHREPTAAVEDFLDLVDARSDEITWLQFLKALDIFIRSCRRLFVSDEEWTKLVVCSV